MNKLAWPKYNFFKFVLEKSSVFTFYFMLVFSQYVRINLACVQIEDKKGNKKMVAATEESLLHRIQYLNNPNA